MKLIVGTLLAALWATANAAATPEEVARLGKDLTPMGSEVAGNKEGTIPAYTGGHRTLPAGFKPNDPKRWIDPFAADKPLFTITAENMAKYEDKLLVSTKELFKRFPKTFRIQVYPSRRSVWMPDWVNENSIKNASSAKILPNGYGIAGAFGGVPFPIPKSGIEVWWNTELRYRGVFHETNVTTWMVDSAGRRSLNAAFNSTLYYSYYDPALSREKFLSGDGLYYYVHNDFTAPAGRVGETFASHTWTDAEKRPSKAWQYTAGTRRVRSAPDLSYDTPNPGYNGGINFDDTQMTYGSQDRFDWKLIGKAEFYVPYNNYTLQFVTPSSKITTPNHPNPDELRFELHRMWVIEGTPKKGVRHVYSKKVVYVDEDMGGSHMEAYDQGGKLFRGGWSTTVPLYDIGVPYTLGNFFFDFSTGSYWLGSHPGDASVKGLIFPKESDWRKRMDMFTPEYLQANGIR